MSGHPASPSAARHALPTDRPVTSKPRGICKYYDTDRGCYAGDRCKFLHGEAERLTPFDKSKVCRFYAAGFCKWGERCWFVHADPSKVASTSKAVASQSEEEEEFLCSICYDKPATFGLLVGCSHVFCLACIKNWRGSQGKSEDMIQAGTTKTCPMCRTSSRFVTPSAFFYPEGHPMKAEAIERYKASMARVKCKYFENSRPSKRFCPFGKDCFYKHENADGTPYIFEHGAAYYMEHGRSRRLRDDLGIDWTEDYGEDGFAMMLNMISQVFGSSRNTHRALFEDIAAELGTAVLPPVLHPEQAEDNEDLDGEDNADEARSEEEEEDGEASDSAQAVDHDRSEEADPMANPWASMLRAWENWPSEEVVIAPDTADEEVPWGRTTTVDGTAASAHPPSSSSTLDPTIPEFVPSSGFSTSRSSSRAPGSSYHLDRLRPLPPGPSHPSDVEEDLSSHHSGLTTGTYSAGRSMSMDDLFRQFPEMMGPPGCTTDRPHSSIDVSSLLLVSPSPDVPSTSDESSDRTSDRAATPSVNSTAALDPTAVQDADPPFMTDGRGRVVWSSTASSRGAREGRRGRAASSSALALPHAKSSADVLTAEESCNGSSRHESPLQRPAGLPHLVRQRSMPSVAGASASDGRALEELPRPAEFVTDGRGRVVFAPSSH